jgi:predicted AlkP superfamily pyrophosphatase or phosphodiesterase
MKSITSFSIIILLTLVSMKTQSQTVLKGENGFSQPKLIVGIVVDQMRSDYLYRYWDKLGDDGFKKLIREGFECKNTHYNYVPTYTGPGHASIYTGATPKDHGIIGNNWFVKEAHKTLYCVSDTTVQALGGGFGRSGQMSPRNLLSTTISDELRLFSNFRSKVVSVSLKDRAAILPGGHSGKAFWFDNVSNNFISSTYYYSGADSIPQWVEKFNNKQLPQKYLTETWKPLLNINQYTESTSDNNLYENTFDTSISAKPVFNYNLKVLSAIDNDLIRKTPFGNTLAMEMAIAAIEGEKLGADNFCDMLNVSFSSTDYIGHEFGTNAIEIEDTYLRIDKDIAYLINYLNKNFGKENILIFLTADHGALPNPVFLNDNKIPGGFFYSDTITGKIKKYFLQNFQDTSIFERYINEQIYLNDNAIKVRNLNKEKIINDIISLLLPVDFISDVIASTTISAHDFNSGVKGMLSNGFNIKRSGDINVVYKPGFIPSYGGNRPFTGTTHGSPYRYDTMVPLYWYGWNINKGKTVREINITDIAATLSSLLNICQPSGCSGKPIKEIFNY